MKIAVAGGTGVVGRHVVEAARTAGHEVLVLARSAGVDVQTGEGLAAALVGVQAVVDTTNPGTIDEAVATEFFVSSSATLQRVGAEAGVEHLVVLSIVGIDGLDSGYYAAKSAHENAARSGSVPVTVARATQFHEFPAQMIGWTRQGQTAWVPDLRVRTISARAVGQMLVEVAEAPPAGRSVDVGGPDEADLVALAELFVKRFQLGIEVVPLDAGLPPGALLPTENARLTGPTFDQWLETEDAARMVGTDQ